jgi:hypothetical protein
MAIIALRPLLVGNRTCATCEAVPEAASWPNFASVASAGSVGVIDDAQLPEFARRLYAGELPTELAPGIPAAHVLAAMRRVRGLRLPETLQPIQAHLAKR